MLGLAQGAFDKAVPYTYERKQFGQAVGTFQGMAFQIAQAAIDLESARLLTYNAARRKEEGRTFTKEAAMAKYWASVVAQRVSGQAIEWAGGVGFTRETGIEKFWRDSKIVSHHLSATEEFLLYLIGSILYRASGCYLRRDVQHSTTNYCQVHSKGIFIESCSELTSMSRFSIVAQS
jgi:alkylation response protein AidB-like acyl-CoA dehydrogenase